MSDDRRELNRILQQQGLLLWRPAIKPISKYTCADGHRPALTVIQLSTYIIDMSSIKMPVNAAQDITCSDQLKFDQGNPQLQCQCHSTLISLSIHTCSIWLAKAWCVLEGTQRLLVTGHTRGDRRLNAPASYTCVLDTAS